MTSRRFVNLLSFHLLNHDLQPEEFGDGPYRTGGGLVDLEDDDLFELAQLLTTKIEQLKPEFDKPEDELYFNQIAKKFEYDYESLKEDHLKIQRIGATDYVTVSFESEKAELSAFAASKFSQAFIDYFESLRTSENEETLKYLGETAKDKKKILTNKQTALKKYESNEGLVDLESQREATVNQIKDLEQQRNASQSTVAASNKTIKSLALLIEKNAPVLTKTVADDIDNEATLLINKKIINLKGQVAEIRNNLIDGVGNKRKNESRLKSVKRQLEQEVKTLAKLKKDEILEKEQVEDNTISNELFEKTLRCKTQFDECSGRNYNY